MLLVLTSGHAGVEADAASSLLAENVTYAMQAFH
jgi:hypothetical protein